MVALVGVWCVELPSVGLTNHGVCDPSLSSKYVVPSLSVVIKNGLKPVSKCERQALSFFNICNNCEGGEPCPQLEFHCLRGYYLFLYFWLPCTTDWSQLRYDATRVWPLPFSGLTVCFTDCLLPVSFAPGYKSNTLSLAKIPLISEAHLSSKAFKQYFMGHFHVYLSRTFGTRHFKYVKTADSSSYSSTIKCERWRDHVISDWRRTMAASLLQARCSVGQLWNWRLVVSETSLPQEPASVCA